MAHTVLMPGFTGTSVPSWLARAIEDGLGAVLYFAPNLTGDPAALSAQLHKLRPEVLVASDEEGGAVTRLHAGSGSPHPGHAELGTGDPTRTRDVAAELGRGLRVAGIDVALSPVLDINSDPDNPVIGKRAFGSSPVPVARHGKAFITGLHDVGVAAVAKHFPGHGDTRTDSHVALPSIAASMSTLRERELVPFAEAIQAGVDMVMAGHLAVPAVDDAPASVSRRAYALLRDELGFTGVTVTDALDMRALTRDTQAGGAREAIAHSATSALIAGADLLCLGSPFTSGESAEAVFHAARDRLLEAVQRGALPRARLAEAATRVEHVHRRRSETAQTQWLDP